MGLSELKEQDIDAAVARAIACIELRIPRTGNKDLDALIREAQRRDVAAMAMQGMLAQVDGNSSPSTWDAAPDAAARASVRCADALLAELAKPQEADHV